MSGFLHIRNLSEQDMTTFFTGEIMTSSHDFFTNSYGAELKIDIQHWVLEHRSPLSLAVEIPVVAFIYT